MLAAALALAGCAAGSNASDVCEKATATVDEIASIDRSASDPDDAATLNVEITRLMSELQDLDASGAVDLAIDELADAYALFTALTVESANGGDVQAELDDADARVDEATQGLRDACSG